MSDDISEDDRAFLEAAANQDEDPECDREVEVTVHVPYYGRERNAESIVRSIAREMRHRFGREASIGYLGLHYEFDPVVDDGNAPDGYVPEYERPGAFGPEDREWAEKKFGSAEAAFAALRHAVSDGSVGGPEQ